MHSFIHFSYSCVCDKSEGTLSSNFFVQNRKIAARGFIASVPPLRTIVRSAGAEEITTATIGIATPHIAKLHTLFFRLSPSDRQHRTTNELFVV